MCVYMCVFEWLVPAHTWLWCQEDGKHVGSGNYSRSKHFSWMISFGTAGELGEKASGRQIILKQAKAGAKAAVKVRGFPRVVWRGEDRGERKQTR